MKYKLLIGKNFKVGVEGELALMPPPPPPLNLTQNVCMSMLTKYDLKLAQPFGGKCKHKFVFYMFKVNFCALTTKSI